MVGTGTASATPRAYLRECVATKTGGEQDGQIVPLYLCKTQPTTTGADWSCTWAIKVTLGS